MRAVFEPRYGSAEVLEVRELPIPVVGDGELLIRIEAASVTATDPTFRRGTPLIVRLFGGITRPRHPIPGDTFAGVIERVGNGVERWRVGDEVFGATGVTRGGHAEYIVMPQTGALAAKPSELTYSEAASTIDSGLTALPFLRDTSGGIGADSSVLVNGAAGSIGAMALQLLTRHFGVTTVTAVCSAANAEFVRALGATETIDYNEHDFAADGARYDVIFDAVGKRSFNSCKAALTAGGVYMTTVPTIGGMLQSLHKTGKRGGKRSAFAATGLRSSEERAADLVRIGELVHAGKVRPLIERRYRMEQIADAHRYIETGHKRGDAVLEIGAAANQQHAAGGTEKP